MDSEPQGCESTNFIMNFVNQSNTEASESNLGLIMNLKTQSCEPNDLLKNFVNQ